MVGRGRIEGGTRIPLWSLTNKELLTLVPPSVTIDVRADVCQTRKKDGRCLSIFFSLAMETTGSRVWNQSVRASYDEWSNRFRELFDLFSTPNELERHSVNRDALN